MEIDANKPLFNGNMFEYEGGMMYFPDGIDAWCRRHGVEILEIRADGDVWVFRTGKAKWEEFPFDAPDGKVVEIKRA